MNEATYNIIQVGMKIPAFIWTTDIEPGALQQIKNLCNLPFAFHHLGVMPDVHQGYGMAIGCVLATEGVVIPNAVGYDGGCGMVAVKTSIKTDSITKAQIREIRDAIEKRIPTGEGREHSTKQAWDGFDKAPNIDIVTKTLQKAQIQLGTLGGGNHFIELQAGDDGNVWLMLHSGSRKLGHTIAEHYHNIAKGFCEKWHSDLPTSELAFLPIDIKEGKEYLEAMNFALDYAMENRARMMMVAKEAFCETLPCEFEDEINIHHNYAKMEHHFGRNVMVHRKGATSAKEGERGIIPGSMGSPSYIVEGLGSRFSFMSCSHGAGREMGRNEASRRLKKWACEKKMNGIEYAGFKKKTKFKKGKKVELEDYDLGEAPQAYKDIDEVMKNQSDLVKPLVKLKPLGVVKG